jgi:hypothetical protein
MADVGNPPWAGSSNLPLGFKFSKVPTKREAGLMQELAYVLTHGTVVAVVFMWHRRRL